VNVDWKDRVIFAMLGFAFVVAVIVHLLFAKTT